MFIPLYYYFCSEYIETRDKIFIAYVFHLYRINTFLRVFVRALITLVYSIYFMINPPIFRKRCEYLSYFIQCGPFFSAKTQTVTLTLEWAASKVRRGDKGERTMVKKDSGLRKNIVGLLSQGNPRAAAIQKVSRYFLNTCTTRVLTIPKTSFVSKPVLELCDRGRSELLCLLLKFELFSAKWGPISVSGLWSFWFRCGLLFCILKQTRESSSALRESHKTKGREEHNNHDFFQMT